MKKILLFLIGALFTFGTYAQTNILTNGNFGTDVDPMPASAGTEWGMWTDNGGVVSVVNGVVVAVPGAASPDNWHLQVEQLNFMIENGKTYTVKFLAWSTAARNLGVTVEDPANGYAQLGTSTDPDAVDGNSKWNIAISADTTQYIRTFTCTNVQGNSTFKFAFLLSETTETVYIDSVSLTESTQVGLPGATSDKLSISPNPASNMLKVSGNVGKINVFDLTGKLVISSSDENIDVSSLSSGIYVVKSGNMSERLVIKR